MPRSTALLLIALIYVVAGQRPPEPGLHPRQILETALHGGVLAFDVDIAKCDLSKMPATLPIYSFGEVASEGQLQYDAQSQDGWTFTTGHHRPINGSRFNVTGEVDRVTELSLSPKGEDDAVGTFLMSDKERASGKALATGTIVCNTSSGGLTVMASRPGGQEMAREEEIRDAFRRGHELTLTLDLATCTKAVRHNWVVVPRRVKAAQSILTARLIGGYRIPKQSSPQASAVEFTFIRHLASQSEVYNIMVEAGNKVTVKIEKLTTPISETTYTCTHGQGFRIYRGPGPQ